MNNPFSYARTLLFTPGNRPEHFTKAHDVGADGIVIDLEDAISLAEKDTAREAAFSYLKTRPVFSNFTQALRINSLQTHAGFKDVVALVEQDIRPDALVLPKVEYLAELQLLDQQLAPKPIPYMVLIESGKGLEQAAKILKASPNVAAVVFGGADLAADLGAIFAWEPMLWARSRIVQAAATAGVPAFDVPYLNIHDADDTGLIEETKRVQALGFSGKLSIHPKHIPGILSVFTPSKDQIERAQAIVTAYENAKGNACEFQGKMIDVPVYKAAKRVLVLGSSIT